MFETMYAAPGIGLAASQVDWHYRLIVIDVSEDKNQPEVFINPQILSREGEATGEEGCLSVPGIFDEVAARRARARARAGRRGPAHSCSASSTGMLAVCLQHEMDHLEGKLFVDYLSEMKRAAHPQEARQGTTRARRAPRARSRPRQRVP